MFFPLPPRGQHLCPQARLWTSLLGKFCRLPQVSLPALFLPHMTFCLLPSEAILRCSGSLPLSGELLPCSPAPVIGVRSPDPKASFATHLLWPLNRYSRGWGTFKGMPAGGLWVG